MYLLHPYQSWTKIRVGYNSNQNSRINSSDFLARDGSYVTALLKLRFYDKATKFCEISTLDLSYVSKGQLISKSLFGVFSFLQNKIEGTPILKLAMVKRLEVKNSQKNSQKNSPKKITISIHTIGYTYHRVYIP